MLCIDVTAFIKHPVSQAQRELPEERKTDRVATVRYCVRLRAPHSSIHQEKIPAKAVEELKLTCKTHEGRVPWLKSLQSIPRDHEGLLNRVSADAP